MKERFEPYFKEYPEELTYLISLLRGHSAKKSQYAELQINDKNLLYYARRHKLIPFIAPHLKRNPPSGFSAFDRLSRAQQKTTQRTMGMLREMVLLSKTLHEKNIPHLMLKGHALSQLLYDSPYQKNSIDIDVLISPDDLDSVDSFLRTNYKRTYPSIDLSDKQKQINYHLTHHYAYLHKTFNFPLEIHWKLINPSSLLPFSFDYLYRNSRNIDINGWKIPTLNRKDYLVYLAVHGSKHRWYFLAWLKDFAELLKQTSREKQHEAIEKCIALHLEKPIIQGYLLAHLFCDTQIPDRIMELYNKEKKIDAFISKAILDINKPLDLLIRKKYQNKQYQLKLRKNLQYKRDVLCRLKTHHKDWEIIDLPDRLFFVYYLLRPVLYFIRLFRKN